MTLVTSMSPESIATTRDIEGRVDEKHSGIPSRSKLRRTQETLPFNLRRRRNPPTGDDSGRQTGDMSGADDEMPPAIGEYMSMMLFDSDEDQPLEDESDEDQPTEKEGDEGVDLEEDDLVDEENNVPEVEVDMADFTLNLDGDESEIHIDGGAADEEVDEDLDVIDNERWDSLDEGSNDDMRRRNVLKNLGKEKRCNLGNVHKPSFYVGKKFKSKKELKDLVDAHAIQTRNNLYFEKNDKLRLWAKCRGVVVGSLSSGVVGTTKSKDKCVKSKKEGCKWALHASRSNEESDWFVKTLKDNHSCLRSKNLRACTATFLSKEILRQIETDPRVPLPALVEQIESKYEVGVSMDKIFRAKAAATNIVVGDYTKQYEILRDYCLELQATNPGTTIKIDVYSEPNPSNPSRMYSKARLQACGRDILGFDGAFMKEPFPWQVLTAVGLDSNNGIYPVAYAIVESENIASWKWFLDCLGDDLDLGVNSNFTFITDRQKGLIPAIFMSRSQRGSSSQATNQDEGIRIGKDGAKKLTRKYGKLPFSRANTLYLKDPAEILAVWKSCESIAFVNWHEVEANVLLNLRLVDFVLLRRMSLLPTLLTPPPSFGVQIGKQRGGRDDGGWTRVVGRRNKAEHRRASIEEELSKVVTTFFVNNLPEGCNSTRLWKRFEESGTLVDAFVPGKRDVSGRLFGFVRFLKVSNLHRMLKKLNELLLDGQKVRVNVARHDRPKASKKGDTECKVKTGRKGHGRQKTVLVPLVMLGVFPSWKFCKVIRGSMERKVNWAVWFSWLRAWEDSFMERSRAVLLKIRGVPISCWNSSMFSHIAEKFGRVLIPVDCSEEDKDLSQGRICVLCPSLEAISPCMVTVLWKTNKFVVQVKEDGDWKPVLESWEPSSGSEGESEFWMGEDGLDPGAGQCRNGDMPEEADGESPVMSHASAHAPTTGGVKAVSSNDAPVIEGISNWCVEEEQTPDLREGVNVTFDAPGPFGPAALGQVATSCGPSTYSIPIENNSVGLPNLNSLVSELGGFNHLKTVTHGGSYDKGGKKKLTSVKLKDVLCNGGIRKNKGNLREREKRKMEGEKQNRSTELGQTSCSSSEEVRKTIEIGDAIGYGLSNNERLTVAMLNGEGGKVSSK
ncbi:hypothetical protein LXL04_039506 [Taraxacum kok-saghyz]